ncbi:hypothetical protein CCICO_04235 [Corynebacterium ciconiae DSM 44920]|uniref:hypothetical protein n=1 Tax=Corynebacterium ciconiae TaxID=227319 RepID=UPI0026474B4A|nr:hypothetical protein [Corynebacterium ciconiae]WKD60884.1 hypothetical protein CCICO_04235 [Corynebacterium ciconiae DSM 44920]
MATVKTTRVRSEWVDEIIEKYGTLTGIAEVMGVGKSTASRWLSGTAEASPRCIGTVLMTFPVEFDEAFVVVEEEAERRRARVYSRATGRAAA